MSKEINSFFYAYYNFWALALDFKGETSRKNWWYVQLANLIITVITLPFFISTSGFNLYGILCILPQIAIDLRRLNDFGKDWKWIFINLVPFLGWFLWWIWLGFGRKGKGRSSFL